MISIQPKWQPYSDVSQLKEGVAYLMIVKPSGHTPFNVVNQHGWYIPFVTHLKEELLYDRSTDERVDFGSNRVYFTAIENAWEAKLLEDMTSGHNNDGDILHVISKPQYSENNSGNERGDTTSDTTERVSQSEEVQSEAKAQQG